MSKSETPLVSVYVTTHNRRELVREAIESVLSQTYKNIEIIVVDDASSDGTSELLSQYEKAHQNFRYFSLPENKGAPFGRNLAIEHSRGEFVTGLDDDDRFTDDRVSLFIESYEPSYSFLCSTSIKFNGDKNKVIFSSPKLISWEDIKQKNHVGNQVFIAKDRLERVGGFDESFVAWQDYDLWFRLIKEFGAALRISEATYVNDVQPDVERITFSSKAFVGYEQFIKKHSADLTEDDLARQKINHYSNQNKKPSYDEIKMLVGQLDGHYSPLNSLVVKTYLPFIYTMYRSYILAFRWLNDTSFYNQIKKIYRLSKQKISS